MTRLHPDVSEFFGGFSGRLTFSLILDPPAKSLQYGMVRPAELNINRNPCISIQSYDVNSRPPRPNGGSCYVYGQHARTSRCSERVDV